MFTSETVLVLSREEIFVDCGVEIPGLSRQDIVMRLTVRSSLGCVISRLRYRDD